MSSQFDIAVVGVADTVGETVLALLEERGFPLGKLFPLERESQAGNKIQLQGKYQTVLPLESFDFSQVQIAIFAVADPVAAEYVPAAVASDCVVIDHSACFCADDEVPLVVAEVNPEAIADFRARGIIACPAPITSLVLQALKPIYDAVGIKSVNIASYQAVTDLGKSGAEELAAQTTALLNMQEVEHKVFEQQIAFNVLAQIGEIENNGYSREEMRMIRESQKILRDEAIVINATAVRVPVFFGHCAALNVETADKIALQDVYDVLQNASGVTLSPSIAGHEDNDPETGGLPTPVSDAAGSEELYVGRLRENIASPHGLDMWIVGDNVRRGAALNSVQIAEFLVKDFL